MIKNQKQANLVKERLQMLIEDKAVFEASREGRTPAELLLGINSFDALISDLKSELEEYEQLSTGNLHILSGYTINDLAKLLIGARIAQKISHKELAERVGIQEQQIQRYEATDYESANLVRLREVATALNINCFFEKIIIICDEPTFEVPDELTKETVQVTQSQIRERKALLFIE